MIGTIFDLSINKGTTSTDFGYIMCLKAAGVIVDRRIATTIEELKQGTKIAVTGVGIFANDVARSVLCLAALLGVTDEYILVTETGLTLRGRFTITTIDYTGMLCGLPTYHVTLQSDGKVEVIEK